MAEGGMSVGDCEAPLRLDDDFGRMFAQLGGLVMMERDEEGGNGVKVVKSSSSTL
jgi:hypothetical protein